MPWCTGGLPVLLMRESWTLGALCTIEEQSIQTLNCTLKMYTRIFDCRMTIYYSFPNNQRPISIIGIPSFSVLGCLVFANRILG